MCDIKINFIMPIYKIIVAAGNALWESHPLTSLNRISYCHRKTKHWPISWIQHGIFLSILLRAYLQGMLKFSQNFPLAAGSPALHAAGCCMCDACSLPPLRAQVHGLLQE